MSMITIDEPRLVVRDLGQGERFYAAIGDALIVAELSDEPQLETLVVETDEHGTPTRVIFPSIL